MEKAIYNQILKLLKKLPTEEIFYSDFNGYREVRIELLDEKYIRIGLDKRYMEKEHLEFSGSYGGYTISSLTDSQIHELHFYFDIIKKQFEDQLFAKLVVLNNDTNL